MRPREFITLVGGVAAWPVAAHAQQGELVRRIGVLMGFAENDSRSHAHMAAFRDGLREGAHHTGTRRRSRPNGAHRGGLGQVNSAERDVSDYNLERKRTSSTSSAGLPKRRAADTYPCDASWPVLAMHVFGHGVKRRRGATSF